MFYNSENVKNDELNKYTHNYEIFILMLKIIN